MTALLNPPDHDALARRLISLATEAREKLDANLVGSVMDRELYLQEIGARKHIDALIRNMQSTYDKEVLK